MQSPRLLAALKLSVLLVLLTAAHAWPIGGPPSAASAAEVTTSALTETLASPPANGAIAAATPTPVAEVYVEGILDWGIEGCVFLYAADELYLLSDLQGFGVGDRVGVWGNFCSNCFSFCLAGVALIVKGIVGLEPVGGVAELPEAAGSPLEAGGSSGSSPGVLAGIAAALAAGAVALGGAAWWARRRRSV